MLVDGSLKIVLVLDAHICGLTHDHVHVSKILKAFLLDHNFIKSTLLTLGSILAEDELTRGLHIFHGSNKTVKLHFK